MAIDNLLPSVVAVHRKTLTGDGRGGHPITYPYDHDETVRIGAPSGKDVPVAMRKEGLVLFPVYGQVEIDIQMGDRLILGSRTFEVRITNLGPPAGPYSKCLAIEYVPIG